MFVLVGIVAFGPSLLLMAFFYRLDRYEPEPFGHVLAALGLGAVSVIPAVLAAGALENLVGTDFLLLGGWHGRLVDAFLLEGLAEEIMKWLVLVLVVYRWPEFDEPMDGIIYGVAVALGFGTVENVVYVAREGLGVGLLRAVFAVPEHSLFGASMGALVGRARIDASLTPGWRRLTLAASLLVATVLHGSYDFLLLELGGVVMYAVLAAGSVALWIFVLRRVRQASAASPFKPLQ